jgi:hypothetical protein
MSVYIGTKIVHAEPMTREDFQKTVRKLGPFTNDEPVHHGYYVRYADGYKSWSPKDVFEMAYRLVDPAEFELLREG